MAAGLTRLSRRRGGDLSAGTRAGGSVNELSAEVLLDLGADIRAEHPTELTEEASASRPRGDPGTRTRWIPWTVTVERWETDEPSLRGIEAGATWSCCGRHPRRVATCAAACCPPTDQVGPGQVRRLPASLSGRGEADATSAKRSASRPARWASVSGREDLPSSAIGTSRSRRRDRPCPPGSPRADGGPWSARRMPTRPPSPAVVAWPRQSTSREAPRCRRGAGGLGLRAVQRTRASSISVTMRALFRWPLASWGRRRAQGNGDVGVAHGFDPTAQRRQGPARRAPRPANVRPLRLLTLKCGKVSRILTRRCPSSPEFCSLVGSPAQDLLPSGQCFQNFAFSEAVSRKLCASAAAAASDVGMRRPSHGHDGGWFAWRLAPTHDAVPGEEQRTSPAHCREGSNISRTLPRR